MRPSPYPGCDKRWYLHRARVSLLALLCWARAVRNPGLRRGVVGGERRCHRSSEPVDRDGLWTGVHRVRWARFAGPQALDNRAHWTRRRDGAVVHTAHRPTTTRRVVFWGGGEIENQRRCHQSPSSAPRKRSSLVAVGLSALWIPAPCHQRGRRARGSKLRWAARPGELGRAIGSRIAGCPPRRQR
jgi:hypothetical protein